MFSGIGMATFAASGLFFLKIWVASRDRFFLLFFIACEMLAFERFVLFQAQGGRDLTWTLLGEANFLVYLIRLCAFLIILFAIIEKNRPSRKL